MKIISFNSVTTYVEIKKTEWFLLLYVLLCMLCRGILGRVIARILLS